MKAIDELVEKAIEAGCALEGITDENTVKLVFDSMEVGYENDKIKFKVNGVDLGDRVATMHITMNSKDFPRINVIFYPQKKRRTSSKAVYFGAKK